MSATDQGGGRPVFAYQSALDGLRAAAVVAVLLFHAGFGWMSGGYLGVSVFFTLSGYLITGLLLVEFDTRGRVAYGAFIGRRLRRLAPASLLCLVAVMVARTAGAFEHVEALRSDVVAAALHVFNWAQLVGTGSYGALFDGGASPLEHFWSLAVEEQFYWVWPAVFAVLARWTLGRRGGRTAALTGLFAAAAIAAPVIAAVVGPDAAYWSTPARLAEILAGAALAAALHERRLRVPGRAATAAVPSLVVITVLSAVLPAADGFAYAGGLPLVGVVSAVLVWGLQGASAVRVALSWWPVVYLGRISYGVYLFHWPVFTVMRERGWRIDTLGGFTVATAITVAISIVSFRMVEVPVRTAGWSLRRTALTTAPATAAVVVAAITMMAPGVPLVRENTELFEQAGIVASDDTTPLATVPITTNPAPASSSAAAPATTVAASDGPGSTASVVTDLPLPPAPARPVRVLVVGDSTALYLAEGLAEWSLDHPAYAQTSVHWVPAGTFILEPEVMTYNEEGGVEESRQRFLVDVPATIAEMQPDVVVMMVTVLDIANRRWSMEEGTLGPQDPRYRERMAESYRQRTQELLDLGVPEVVWVVPAAPTHEWFQPELNDDDRYAIHREVVRAVPDGFDDRVSLFDLHAWSEAVDLRTSESWRPDGVHLEPTAALDLAERVLGPHLVTVAQGG